MADRVGNINLRARNQMLRADLKKAEKQLQTFSQNSSKSIKSGFKASLGGLAALGTTAGFAGLATDAIKFEDTLTRIGIQASGDLDVAKFRKDLTAISKETGLSKADILKAAEASVNLEGAIGATAGDARALAMAAAATGAEISDLAGMKFAMKSQFGLSDADDIIDAYSTIIANGKAGSITLGEMSQAFESAGSSMVKAFGQGREAIAKSTAALNVVRTSFGSASEAANGFSGAVDAIEQNALKLQGLGIKVFDKDGQMRDMLEISKEIYAKYGKTKRGKEMFSQIIGSANARKAIVSMGQNASTIEDLTAKSLQSNAAIDDTATYMASSAGKMKSAFNEIKASLSQAFTPDRIEKMADAAQFLAKAVGFMTDHWKTFLSVMVAFKAAQLVSTLTQMSGATAALAGNASSAAGSMGKVAGTKFNMAGINAWGAGLAAAALAGWEIGKALDNAFGLSNKLADTFMDLEDWVGDVTGAKKSRRESQKKYFSAQEGIAKTNREIQETLTFGKTLSPQELEERRKKSLELSKIQGQKTTALRAAEEAVLRRDVKGQEIDMELLAEMFAKKFSVENEVAMQRMTEAFAIVLDGEKLNKGLKNQPSNRRGEPK